MWKRGLVAAAIGGLIAIFALGVLFVADSHSAQLRSTAGLQAYVSSGKRVLLPPNSLDKRLDISNDPYHKVAWEMMAFVWFRDRINLVVGITLGLVAAGFVIGVKPTALAVLKPN